MSSTSPDELATLADLATGVLRCRWSDLFGAEPVRRISRELLIRGIAYRLQEKSGGGPAKKTLRQIDRLGKEFAASGAVRIDSVRDLRPGTRIVKEWQGQVHEVIVLDDGFLWKGCRYRSLSEIARLITGTRWSGPRFFGILAKKDKRRSADPVDVPSRAAGAADG